MGQDTTIETCDHTFNPIIGCVKVSDGCKNCYAEEATPTRVLRASYGLPLWGPHGVRHRTSASNWMEPRKWHKNAAKARLNAAEHGQTYTRPLVFCASLSDVFEDHPTWDKVRQDLWELILETDELDWMLLTKRPENIRDMVPREWLIQDDGGMHCLTLGGMGWPDHVWVGTSCENQEAADRRIPHLLRVPAPVRFLSCEPLLGPIEMPLEYIAPFADNDPALQLTPRINWVIAGGESGGNARHCAVEWIEDLAAQCKDAGVPFFAKQLGDNRTGGGNRIVGAGAKGHDLEAAGYGFLPREWPQRRQR